MNCRCQYAALHGSAPRFLAAGDCTGSDRVVNENDMIPTRRLCGFRLVDGTLQQASLPILGKRIERVSSNFYSCRNLKATVTWTSPSTPTTVGVGDFDGDGADDLLWRRDGTVP